MVWRTIKVRLAACSAPPAPPNSAPHRKNTRSGLYALSGKATAFLAPLLIALVTDISGNQRLGISPLIGLFILSLVLLVWVKPDGEVEQ